MAKGKRSKGGGFQRRPHPKHGAAAGKPRPKPDEPESGDDEEESAGVRDTFTNTEAQERAVGSAKLSAGIALLTRKMKRHRRILKETREARETYIADLCALNSDAAKGQGRLEFDKAEKPDEAKPPPPSALPPLDFGDFPKDVEFVADVGGKSCVVRQDDPGEWTGRIGDLPFAARLSLDKAQRICASELLKGQPEGTKVEWVRTTRKGQVAIAK